MTKTLYTGSAAVTIEVDIAFTTTNPLTAAPTWTDVTQYVQGVTIRRGRWTETTNRYDAGTASVQLNNSTRIFDPLYSAGTFFGQLVPMKQIRVRAVYSAVTYELFRGFVDGFPQGWDPTTATFSTSTVTCTDAFGFLSNVNLLDRYANEVLQDSPFGYWRCGDTDNQMVDSTSNGRHGAWSGATSQDSSTGLVLSDGSSRLLATGGVLEDLTYLNGRSTGQAFYTGVGDNITFECWLFLTAPVVFATASVANGTIGYYAPLIDSGATITFGDSIPSGVIQCSAISSTSADQKSYQLSFPQGQWVHVVMTYVKNSTLAVYFNGKVVASTSSGRLASFFTFAPQAGIYIENQDQTGDASSNFFVDEVAVYPSALSATRVAAHYKAGVTGYNLEQSGARIGSVLDTIGWPSGLRTLSNGDSWLSAGPTPATALDYLQTINETEQGRFYAATDGTLVFRDRTWELQTAAANTSQATFGDSGAELRYQNLVLDGGQITSIFNSVQVTPASGVTGVAEDSTSVTNYGRHVQAINSLHANQTDARNLGSWRLAKYKDPNLNFTTLELHAKRDPTNLFPLVLGLDFGSRVTVTRRPQGVGSAISQDRAVDGIEHVITHDDWQTTFYLTQPTQTITAAGWWKVGDATNGKVGTAKVPY